MAEKMRLFQHYSFEAKLTLGGRELFRTDSGLLGLGPYALRETDEICILGGAKVPFALRRITGKPRHYQLIGECYVHGIMSGNGMQHFDTTPHDIVLDDLL